MNAAQAQAQARAVAAAAVAIQKQTRINSLPLPAASQAGSSIASSAASSAASAATVEAAAFLPAEAFAQAAMGNPAGHAATLPVRHLSNLAPADPRLTSSMGCYPQSCSPSFGHASWQVPFASAPGPVPLAHPLPPPSLGATALPPPTPGRVATEGSPSSFVHGVSMFPGPLSVGSGLLAMGQPQAAPWGASQSLAVAGLAPPFAGPRQLPPGWVMSELTEKITPVSSVKEDFSFPYHDVAFGSNWRYHFPDNFDEEALQLQASTATPLMALRHAQFERNIEHAWVDAEHRHSGVGGYTSRWPPVARRVKEPPNIVRQVVL